MAVRTFLAQRGMKKGDLAKFVEEAVRWRVLDQTVAQTKARNAKASAAQIDAAIDEALQSVRAERFATALVGEKKPRSKRGTKRTRRQRPSRGG